MTAIIETNPGYIAEPEGFPTMKITYDGTIDAAYIQFTDDIPAGGVAFTYPCDPEEVGGMINLDFDTVGVCVGMEVLDASKLLPGELLNRRNKEGDS